MQYPHRHEKAPQLNPLENYPNEEAVRTCHNRPDVIGLVGSLGYQKSHTNSFHIRRRRLTYLALLFHNVLIDLVRSRFGSSRNK